MRLLVVSHACVTPINQEFYAEIECQSGWDVSLIIPSSWQGEYGEKRAKRWSAFEGKIESIPVWPSGNIPLHIYRTTFLRLFRRLQPDVIYVHNEPYAASTAQVLFANRLSGLNVPFGFYSAQNIRKTYPPPFRWTEQHVYRMSQFAFPCSQTVLDTLRKKGYKAQATYLPLSIDPELYRPDPDRDAFRRQFSGGDEVVIGYLGRITEEKGLDTLFHALSLLPDKVQWKMVMVGEGQYEEDLRSLAHTLGLNQNLEWTGYVKHEKAPRYLSAFDILVLPSETQPNWKEQFGRVLIEAMACGTPVLGSDSGEIPHLIDRTGGGLIFSEGNPDHCSRQLAQLLRDQELREKLAQEGQVFVYDHYTHTALAHTFIDTIRSL